LVDDPEHGEALITNVECPHCCQMFCVQCKVPWHAGVTCAEFKFQRPRKDEQGREDLLPRKVEQESKWQRCPECKIYVERIGDCVFIVYKYCSQIEHSLH
jgi:E3 ubiquitin-protein ligase RNF144